MNINIENVSVPQLGVNDEEAELIEWCIPDEDIVSKDDLLCRLEIFQLWQRKL